MLIVKTQVLRSFAAFEAALLTRLVLIYSDNADLSLSLSLKHDENVHCAVLRSSSYTSRNVRLSPLYALIREKVHVDLLLRASAEVREVYRRAT